jgi:hypothetical protein
VQNGPFRVVRNRGGGSKDHPLLILDSKNQIVWIGSDRALMEMMADELNRGNSKFLSEPYVKANRQGLPYTVKYDPNQATYPYCLIRIADGELFTSHSTLELAQKHADELNRAQSANSKPESQPVQSPSKKLYTVQQSPDNKWATVNPNGQFLSTWTDREFAMKLAEKMNEEQPTVPEPYLDEQKLAIAKDILLAMIRSRQTPASEHHVVTKIAVQSYVTAATDAADMLIRDCYTTDKPDETTPDDGKTA